MPEFILPGSDAIEFRNLPDVARGYIEAAFFTAPRLDEGEGGIPDDHGFDDLSPNTLDDIRRDCERFADENKAAIETLESNGFDREQIGRDLWFTRNRHGVGFWSRDAQTPEAEAALAALDDAARKFGECDMCLGDDGKVYLHP